MDKRSAVVFLFMLLSACAGRGPAPVEDREVESRVREPAKQDSAGVQVFPLQNPAVKELIADASAAESAGDYSQAATLLERALRIQPRDPEILQNLAVRQKEEARTGDAIIRKIIFDGDSYTVVLFSGTSINNIANYCCTQNDNCSSPLSFDFTFELSRNPPLFALVCK